MPKRSVLVTVTQPLDWVELFEQCAAEKNQKFSEWIGQACLEKAACAKNTTIEELSLSLTQRKKPGRPKGQ